MLINDQLDNFPSIRWLSEFILQNDKPQPAFICGGCFKDAFQGTKIKDIDIFFPDESAFNSFLEGTKKNNQYTLAYETPKVVGFLHKERNIQIELVRSVFGTIEQILEKFDFTVAMFGITHHQIGDDKTEFKCVFHKQFFQHLYLKQLVNGDLMNFHFPLSSFNRMIKYGRYGFAPCRETKLKIIQAIRNLPEMEQTELSRDLYEAFD